jgi:GxxExxY protein
LILRFCLRLFGWCLGGRAASPQITQIDADFKTMRDERTYNIIGAAIEVHKELGCGFLEAVYQEALGREFISQKIPYQAQPIIEIHYKGKPLDKTYQPDFLCFDEVIVEIKAMSNLSGVEEAQLLNYLKATRLQVGLLINFGSKSLEHKRFVRDY